MRRSTKLQSVWGPRAARAASTLQLTGLNLDTERIQSGITFLAIRIGERNISGIRMKFDAPMTDSGLRTRSASALDKAANGAANNVPQMNRTMTPPIPPAKRAPVA